ncbi:FAD-dependent oxidoreductase [Rhodobacteraceae bacterium WD3A24]|nr:FAD-dependent oxidoreductase [Rhodobacteraceae bacterium WD3A24]
MAMAEVTVMGGGIFGLSVAWACLRRGARVRLIEARRIGAGASGGVVGALAPHVPENWNPKKAFQLESLLMASGWWADVARAGGGAPGYGRLGRLQPLADAAAVTRARARADTAAELWQGRARWEVVALSQAPAGLGVESPTGLVVHDTLSARLHPARACAALAAALQAGGAEIVAGRIAPPSGAAPVVWATGHEGLAALMDTSGRPAGTGVKGQALLVEHAAPGAPQIFADGLHIVPHADGTTAIGSTSERVFDDGAATDARLDTLHARAAAVCPDLADAPVLARWAGVRPRARSRAPLLGPWPGRPGHFVANGGFKIGFGVAPGVAEVMADLVLEGRDVIPEGFRVADCL